MVPVRRRLKLASQARRTSSGWPLRPGFAVLVPNEAEFRSNEGFVPPFWERAAQEQFILASAIFVGGIGQNCTRGFQSQPSKLRTAPICLNGTCGYLNQAFLNHTLILKASDEAP